MERRQISQIERLALKKAWGNACAYCEKPVDSFEVDHIVAYARGGSCDLENLCVTCHSCNRRKSATPLPKMYEGLLLSLAARKVKKIGAMLESATQKASKPKKRKVAEEVWTVQYLPKKPFVEFIDIPDTSFAAQLSLSQLSEAYKLLSLILSKGITEKREARWPETLPARVWFESAFVLPLGIANPWDLLKEIKYFGKREDEGCYGGPHLISECEKCTETGEVQFRFTLPMKELKKLKKGITTVLNQAKEAA
jgi:hypothetical protein